MKGAIYSQINEFLKNMGLSEETLVGKIKIRSIRIQISLLGINLANHTPESNDSQEDIQRIKNLLISLTKTMVA
jgi:hypothetical protein